MYRHITNPSRPLRRAIRCVWILALVFMLTPYGAAAQQGEGVAGTAYYVSFSGNDANPGTSLSSPFRTIQKCANVARAGDVCYIRAGTYRETVTPANNGTATNRITFIAYNGELVIISGADVVGGWAPHDLSNGRRIYRTSALTWSMNVRSMNPEQVTNNQVFVDGKMMPEARWPNISPAAVTRVRNAAKAKADGASVANSNSATYLDAALSGVPAGLFNGGKINFAPGYGVVNTTCDVTSQTNSAVAFTCNPDPGASNTRSTWNMASALLKPAAANYYYLWGKLGALDAAGEWFAQSGGSPSANTLYLWMPDGSSPAGTSRVEVRRRAWGLDVSNRSFISVYGLKLFAAGIRTNQATSNFLLDTIEARYTWHFQQIPTLYWTQGTHGILLLGSYITLRNSYLAYSAGPMASMKAWAIGRNVVIQNNVIHDASYMGHAAAIGGTSPGGTQENEVRQNTVFNTGSYIVPAASGVNIRYNDLYSSHLQITDLGVIYGWAVDGKGADIAYNLVHDNWAESDGAHNYWGGFGIYLDDETTGFNVYRNIIWNTTSAGIQLQGYRASQAGVSPNPGKTTTDRRIYNNTVDDELGMVTKSTAFYNGTSIVNNIFSRQVAPPTGPGASLSNNLFRDGLFVNAAARDYRLRADSPAVNTGASLGSPYMDPPMQPVGAPDIGALERGQPPFVAGATVRPKDLAGLRFSCTQYSTDPAEYANCTVTGLPLGRKLPPDFRVRLGAAGTPGQNCLTPMNYATNVGAGRCSVPTNGLTGYQPIYYQLAGGAWTNSGATADIGPLAIRSVLPASGSSAGGQRITLTGRRFSMNAPSFNRAINVNNATGAALQNYPVLVTFNSAALIGAGKLRGDCGDLRFNDAYGALDYWLEEGCNTAATRVWVEVSSVPPGNSTFVMNYGVPARTSASNGRRTFALFDDFNDGVISRPWNLGKDGFYTVSERNGKMVIAGTTTSANSSQSAYFNFNDWMVAMPASFAIDSVMSVVAGTNQFKASAGGLEAVMALQGAPNNNPPRFGKNIAYYSNGWQVVGKSNIGTATFANRKFSISYAGPANSRTVRWMENGALNAVLATRTGMNNPAFGFFRYSPDGQASFEVQFDNIRVRNYAYPEPVASVGAEGYTAARVTVGGQVCGSMVVNSPNVLSCLTPAHAPGAVDVVITNPDGASFRLPGGFAYVSSDSAFAAGQAFLPVVAFEEVSQDDAVESDPSLQSEFEPPSALESPLEPPVEPAP